MKSVWGSPPRGRGKVLYVLEYLHEMGITPAWAGKRTIPSLPPPSRRDHPRVGGEKLYTPCMMACIVGSPPRGRGKVLVTRSLVCKTGITPAWAGKRTGTSTDDETFGDHPRVGGEKKAGE